MTLEENIYKYLQEGGNLEEYLKKVQDSANAAQERYKDEQIKKAAKQVADDQKMADADRVIAEFVKFLQKYYPNFKVKGVSGKDLIAVIESFGTLIGPDSIFNMFFKPRSGSVDPIEKFLNEYVR